eukprot:scaffold27137_cov121-Isochrysis_galbana.AAC.10
MARRCGTERCHREDGHFPRSTPQRAAAARPPLTPLRKWAAAGAGEGIRRNSQAQGWPSQSVGEGEAPGIIGHC